MRGAAALPAQLPPRGAVAGHGHIIRHTLLNLITDAQASQVTYLGAPAGYGKTVLLTQLQQELTHRGDRFASLTLDPSHANIGCLVSSLLQALKVGDMEQSDIQDAIATSGSFSCSGIGRPVAQASSARCYLLIDNYDVAADPAVDRFVRRLLQNLPRHVHVVIAGRGLPSFVRTGLRDFRRLTKLDCLDLQLAPSELQQLFGHLHADAQEAANAYSAQARGWPIAVDTCVSLIRQLASRIRDDVGDLATQKLRNFFECEIMADLGDDHIAALECLSMHDSFSRADAHRIVNGSDLVNSIDALIDRQLIVADNWPGERLCISEPLRDHVRTRLANSNPIRHESLVLATAQQHLMSGNWLEAISIAGTAIDRNLLRTIVEDAGGWLLGGRYGFDAFQGTRTDSESDLYNFPRSGLARCVSQARAGAQYEARALFERLSQLRPKSIKPATWRAELTITDIRLHLFSDRLPPAVLIEELERALETDLSDTPILYPLIMSQLTECHYHHGQYDAARTIGHRSIALYGDAAAPFSFAYTVAFTAMAEYRLGNLDEAKLSFSLMRDHVEKWFAGEGSLADVAAILLAHTHYEAGTIADAAELIDRPFQDVFTQEGLLEVGAAAYMTAANIAVLKGEIDRGLAILAAAEKAGIRRGFLRLGEIARLRARFILLLHGRTDEAQTYRTEANSADERLSIANSGTDYVQICRILADAMDLISDCAATEAFDRLSSYLDNSTISENLSVRVRIQVLRFVAMEMIPDRNLADCLPIIRDLFLCVERRGFVSALLEVRNLVEAPLALLVRSNSLPADEKRYVTMLHDRLQHLGAPSARTGATASLSPRQQQLLVLIVDGLSNKEIAQRLAIAEGTVKKYRRILYQKLDISRRSQAVAFAKQLY